VIYLIRHGETAFNAEGRFQGALDSPLTAHGRAQAAAVGATLAKLVAADTPMVSSPLGRARETAELVRRTGRLSGPLLIDPRLAEISIGEWDGLTDEDIEFAYPGARAGHDRWDWHFHAPGGETYDRFRTRLRDWLSAALAMDSPVIAVSHGGCSRMLRGLHLGLPRETFLKLHVPQDVIYRLDDSGVETIEVSA
jgi:broad specificity phosphatase PhoE